MQTQNQTAGALPQIPGWRTAQNAQAPNHSWWPTWQGWGTLPWRRQPRAYPGATQGQPLPPGPTAQRRGPRPPPPLNRTAPGQRHAPPAAIQNAYNWQHRQGPAPQREQAHTPQTTAPQQTTIFYPGAVPNGPAVHTVPVTNQTRAPDPAAATVQNNVLSVPPVHPATHRPAPTYPRTTPVQDNVLRVPPVHPGTERPPAHQAAALTPNQAAAPMPTRAAKVYPTVRPRPVTPYPAPAMLYHAPTPYHSWPSHLPPGNQQAHGHNHHGAGGHRDNKRHPHFDDGNDRGHRILFHDKRKPHYGFTNLSKHNVFYDGKLYPTSEHLFQALKFLKVKPDLAEHIRMCSDKPRRAIEEAHRLRKSRRSDWKDVRIRMMYRAIRHKFKQHHTLRQELLDTGNAKLVEASPTDDFWGIGKDGKGRNELGKALMRLRDEFRREGGQGRKG